MKKKQQTVSAEEYALLQSYKKTLEKEAKKQIRFERMQSLKHNLVRIAHNEREIEFKKDQILNEKSEETHEQFVGGVKPLHYLQSDIDNLELEIEKLKYQNEQIEELLESKQ